MNFEHIIENNLIDHLIISDYDKKSFEQVEVCVGIDEAGRGPVLGPMVYSALFCPMNKQQQLKEMKCADSKTLTEKDRDKIFKTIQAENKFCGFAMKILSPNTISNNMLGKLKYNLNDYSHDTAASLINTLLNDEKLKINTLFLDTVGDPKKYEDKLSAKFKGITIKVSKKADSLYPCVSAASICAKVTRDHLLTHWKFQENLDYKSYGSGYPGDPKTKEFLNTSLDSIFGFTKLVRFSWSTAYTLMDKKCVEVKWFDNFEMMQDDLESSENGSKKVKKKQTQAKKPLATKSDGSILNFFQQKSLPLKRNLPHSNDASFHACHFLSNRKLKYCESF